MEINMGQGFCNLTSDEQLEINGGVDPWTIGAVVVATYIAVREVVRDAGRRAGYNELRNN